MIRSSFANVVKYAIDKEKDARIINSCGVLTKDIGSIISSFEAQASMRPRLTKKVGHIALSFSPEDTERCSDEFLNKIAEEYMIHMGIRNTQFISVRHFDHEHPHIHIIYNRVDNDGKTISDKNQKIKNRKACIALTKRYGLHISNGKENVNRNRLRQPAKSKYAIYDAIKAVLPSCCSWREFCAALSEKDIKVELVTKGKTEEIQGVIFVLNGYRFTGSKIDRRYSYSKLKKQLWLNMKMKEKQLAYSRTIRSSTPAQVRKPVSKGRMQGVLADVGSGGQRNAEYELNDNGYGEVDDERTHYHIHR